MISYIVTLFLVLTFFLSGYIIQALKKFIGLLTKILLNILSIFGVEINKEKSIKLSNEFKDAYKDIKIMKLSNKNLKEKSSIDYINLGLFLACLLLVIINLNSVSGNAISNWLFTCIQNFKIVKTATDMNTLFTATLFSALSFSMTKMVQRWKETKPQREDKKNLKLKIKALKLMTTKELLLEAKNKDENKRKELS